MAHLRMTEDMKARLLHDIEETGNIILAVRNAGINKNTFYYRRKVDPEFDEAVHDAVAVAIAKLEQEARRRALEGVDEPVYQSGNLVGHITRYSDKMLELLLKANAPEKYRDNDKTPGGVTVVIQQFGADTPVIASPTSQPLTLTAETVDVEKD